MRLALVSYWPTINCILKIEKVKDCKKVVQEGINNREKRVEDERRKAKQEIQSDAAKA